MTNAELIFVICFNEGKPVFCNKTIKPDPILSLLGALVPKVLTKVIRALGDKDDEMKKLFEYQDKFPKTAIFQVGSVVRSFPIRQLWAFSKLRKFLMQHIEVEEEGEDDHRIEF